MNYKAFYRTYRPTNFNEVVGQDHIVKTLVNLIKMNKISHGYLFCGPKGTGKTSIAKIFASAINCIHSEKPEEICKRCLENSNRSLDIIEIDAASNNSVNDIRTIREQVEFAPTNSPYKIYIIDEVHMLSKGAFNALLMTLEEPPAHAIFILATTDPDKIPDTILSRLQRYNFKRISKEVLEKQLRYIFEKEKIKFDNQSLEMIVNLANGSLRDALSIADQINAFSNSNITSETLIEIFGLSTIETQVFFLNLLAKKNVSEALQFFEQLVNDGIDISKFITSLIELLKDFLVFTKTKNKSLITTSISIEAIEKIIFKNEIVYKILEELVELLGKARYSDIPQQLMQLTIIKICSINESLIDIEKKDNLIKSLSIDNQRENNEITKKINFEHHESNKNEYRDITDEYFSNTNKINVSSNEKKEQNTKSILSDFSTQKIEKEFNDLIETFSLETEINKIKKEKEFKEINQKNSDEIINHTTELLNVSNEGVGESNEVSETLLNNYDTSKKIFDTNEIELNNSIELEEKNNLNQNLKKQSPTQTKEFNFENNDTTKENPNSIELQNNKVVLSQPAIINLFLLAKKDTFEIFKEKLQLASSTNKDEYDNYAILLKESRFVCSSNDYILVSSEENWVISDLNEKIDDPTFRKFVAQYFGNNIHFYAINKKEYELSKELFKELKKSNKMPVAKPLEKIENFTDEVHLKTKNELNEVENKSKNIFGNLFSRKKE